MQPLVFMTIIMALLLGSSDQRMSNSIESGNDAPDGKYPYHVSIQFRNSHYCGGVIVNRRWILSAAHCHTEGHDSEFTVVAGTNSLSNRENVYQWESIQIHPNYPFVDIALISVTEDIVYNEKVQPARLPKKDTAVGDSVVLIGWKKTAISTDSDRFEDANLRIISREDCNRLAGDDIITDEICTLTIIDGESCYEDPGNPLITDGVVVGVVLGRACRTGFPDSFTRVWSHMKWISETVASGNEILHDDV